MVRSWLDRVAYAISKQRLHGLKKGFRLQHHAFAAAERPVIHGAVAILREHSQILDIHFDQSGFPRAAKDAGEVTRAAKDGGGTPDAPTDILAQLMLARNADGTPMSRGQLRDNVMSVILAGHETTASELAWAFQLLAHHPRVHDRLLAEIDAEAGEDYLTATIQETLRHRPVFLFTIPRTVASPLEIGGIAYRPPARLLGCIYLMHHDRMHYRRPEEFRPERFLQDPGHSGSAVPSEQAQAPAWLPWGGGRKRCPGLHTATMEMKTVLRTALSSVSVHAAARSMERPLWRSVVVMPHAGSRVILRNRRST